MVKSSKAANAMAFLGEMDLPGSRVVSLPVSDISPDPAQPRTAFHTVDGMIDDKTMEELEHLADDIAKNGLIQPITVREVESGKYLIIAGERRWRAMKLNQERGIAGSESINVIVRNDLNDEQLRLVQLAENLQRSDLSDLETAAFLKRMLEEYPHLQKQHLGKLMNKNSQFVSRILAMLDPKWANVVNSGLITYAALLEQYRALPEEQRNAVVAQAQAENRTITSGDIKKARDAVKAEKAGVSPGAPNQTAASDTADNKKTLPASDQVPVVRSKDLTADVLAAVTQYMEEDRKEGETYTFQAESAIPAMTRPKIRDFGGDAVIPAGAIALDPALLAEKRELKVTLGQLAKLFQHTQPTNTNYIFAGVLPVAEMRILLEQLKAVVPDDDALIPMALQQRLNEL